MSEMITKAQANLQNSLLSPTNSEHYYSIAKKMSAASLVPKCYQNKPNDLFLAMALGYKLGFSPEQAAQNIVVINNKPCMYGDALLGLVMTHKDFEDIIETPIEKDGVIVGYECVLKRTGRSDTKRKFTIEQAQKAGLIKRSQVWQQYPERMLQMRARGYAIRDTYPDKLNGLMPAEEVNDYIEGEYTRVDKKSRTEKLRDELSKDDKEQSSNENSKSANDDTKSKDEAPVETQRQSQDSQEMDCNESKSAEHSAENDGNIEEKQSIIKESIDGLMDEIGFTEDSFCKALNYYEVGHIDEMSIQQLEHFESQLKRKKA